MSKLLNVQSKLKAPKNQKNNFGNYNYRSAEDILEAVKPLLAKENLTLTISDEMKQVGDRVYVQATCYLTGDSEQESWLSTAYAREAESKKGMDEAQVTGAASSYARKYALNGMFAIDDTKDADTMDNSKTESAPKKTESAPKASPDRKPSDSQLNTIKSLLLEKKNVVEEDVKKWIAENYPNLKTFSSADASTIIGDLLK